MTEAIEILKMRLETLKTLLEDAHLDITTYRQHMNIAEQRSNEIVYKISQVCDAIKKLEVE